MAGPGEGSGGGGEAGGAGSGGDIGLAEWITSLRSELRRCQDTAEGGPHGSPGAAGELRFLVGPVEIELEVTSARSHEGRAEVKFWVAGTGGSSKHDRQVRQRITLSLTPQSADGRPVRVRDRLDQRPE